MRRSTSWIFEETVSPCKRRQTGLFCIKHVLIMFLTMLMLSNCSEDDPALKSALESGRITASESEADSYTRPEALLLINNGDVSTNQTQVSVQLSAEDLIIMGYYLSDSETSPEPSTSGWVSLASQERFSTTLSKTISATEQSHSFYVWFRDSHGNISDSATDSILYDVTAPAGSVSINSGASSALSTSVTLNLSATDSVGVVAYYASTSSSTPAASNSGWQSITSTTSYSANISFTLSSGTGTKYAYVWYRDFAGNASSVVNDGINLQSGYDFEDGSVPSNFTMSGNKSWYVTSSTAASGSYSLRSGSITHNQSSCFSFTESTTSGSFSFYYRISSESGYDYLRFYLNGSSSTYGSGSQSWRQYVLTVSSGTNTFKWCYTKDGSVSSGYDAAWIDDIQMP